MLTATLGYDLAAALDPVALARRAGIAPDPWQAEVLRATARRLLLNCCRQSGKSTTTAALATHGVLYDPGSLALLVSPSERQSIELLRKVKDTLGALGVPAAEFEKDNTLGIETTSGSRVVALPGAEATVRAFSGVRLILVDEASRALDGLYYAIRPMLAVSGGRLVLLSTPFGKRGFFHNEWCNGGAAWRRFEIPASMCPRISAEFLEEERRSLPRDVYLQEYECQFIEGSGSVFDGDDLAAAFGDVSTDVDEEGYLTL